MNIPIPENHYYRRKITTGTVVRRYTIMHTIQHICFQNTLPFLCERFNIWLLLYQE